jgi:hypothetical protein
MCERCILGLRGGQCAVQRRFHMWVTYHRAVSQSRALIYLLNPVNSNQATQTVVCARTQESVIQVKVQCAIFQKSDAWKTNLHVIITLGDLAPWRRIAQKDSFVSNFNWRLNKYQTSRIAWTLISIYTAHVIPQVIQATEFARLMDVQGQQSNAYRLKTTAHSRIPLLASTILGLALKCSRRVSWKAMSVSLWGILQWLIILSSQLLSR